MPDRPVTHAYAPAQTMQTSLGRGITPRTAENPGKSGIYALQDPRESFAARMLLARHAERTLDVQYYIWHADQTGTLLLRKLVAAADRGVRVRLLLDDSGTSGLDTILAALAKHPMIEVRLFNPFAVRKPKFIGYVTNFSRANRRMHNKSFTADNQASIFGGRNVGDEYFGATDGVLFSDLDVLAIGTIVPQISQDFDRYWASPSAYPAQSVLPAVDTAVFSTLSTEATRITQTESARAYVQAVRQMPFIDELLEHRLPLEWATTTLVSDDPLKGLGHAKRNGLLYRQVEEIIGIPERSAFLVSPYFVPTDSGVRALVGLRKKGIDVRVMTNAYEATDVPLVQAGYAKHRKTLIQNGVQLYEMRRMAPPSDHLRLNPLGSSGSSLHAKTFAVDGERAFVGSFNFDPRSALLNTELGVIIDSPTLAGRIDDAFDSRIPGESYRVLLSDDGELVWQSGQKKDGVAPTVYKVEPGTSWLSRLGIRVLGWLPIDWLL